MNYLFFINTLIILLFGQDLAAQTTFYYQLNKKISNDKTYTNVSGGQFITFLSSICYESDCNGTGIGHGTLKYKELNNNLRTYIGNSYWGSNTHFRFNRERSRLNVITTDGDIYVYVRTTPPSSVKTCSLIRNEAPGGNNSGGYVPTPSVSTQTGSANTRQQPTVEKNKKSRRVCSYCGGKGKVVRNVSVGQYGVKQEVKVRCSECGEYNLPSSGHTHVHCSHCRGTGYIED